MKLKEAIEKKIVTLRSVINDVPEHETHVLDSKKEVVVVYPFYKDALLMMAENDAIKEEFLINPDGDITAILQ